MPIDLDEVELGVIIIVEATSQLIHGPSPVYLVRILHDLLHLLDHLMFKEIFHKLTTNLESIVLRGYWN